MEQAVFQWDTSYYNITVQLYGILLYSNLLYYIKNTIEAVPSGGNFMKHWLVSAVSIALIQNKTVQYSMIQYSRVQYSIVQYSTI